ncbi:arylsulfotransferase family protein [Desulfuromonas sp. TF]|uniref:arylsulfotransferase family protein n=1 Tax=Desulfuromonas sp. TF TaxID=1232410 RepID=UPI00041877AF|nr:arylsulfotransferase family protein [Desulfuromonas sp. TF]
MKHGSRVTALFLKLYFALSALCLVFLIGAGVVLFKVFPYTFLKSGADALVDWKNNWQTYTIRPQAPFLRKNEFGASGVLVHEKGRAYDGVTLYGGVEGKHLSLYLIDMDGNPLHHWDVSFKKIWPEGSKHLKSQPEDLHQALVGYHLLENGDVILNLYRVGMVRLDRCGNVVWRLPIRAHHLFSFTPQGTLWVPCEEAGDRHYGRKENGLGTVSLTITDPEAICEVSLAGELLRSVDPVEAFFHSSMGPMLMPSGMAEYESYHFTSNGDTFTHINDVEVVTEAFAKDFLRFKPGDLLMSLCTQNMLAVMDPDTETIKWSMKGPFFNQHDPDLLPNGKISIFDNLGAAIDPNADDGSRILEVDPLTGASRTVVGSSKANFFLTETEGNKQHLPNGNLLITESVRGRIFEVDKSGEIVWSFVTRWDDDEVVITHEGIRYPASYAAFIAEGCQ